MRRAWLAAQVALALLVAAFVVRALARDWHSLQGSLAQVSLDPVALLAAAGITLATYALLISAWRAVLAGWRERLPYLAATRIWVLSNLARYVPGRVWQMAGMAAMAQKAGVSPWAAAGSAVVVQLLAIATGALVTGLAAPTAGRPLLIAGAGLAAAAAATTLAWAPAAHAASRVLGRLVGRDVRIEPVAPLHLLLSAAATTIAWIAYGFTLYFLVQGILGAPLLSVGKAIGAFTASYLVGLLLVFSPGGLGPREGTIFVLLSGPLGSGPALLVTIASRLLMTGTELLAAALVLPLRSASPDAPSGR